MCRIAGVISKKLTAETICGSIRSMCATLAHGGPDDEGMYFSDAWGIGLGHRRLAIIDLSAKGHQPMADVNEKAWITFNGEIYNYQILKNELIALGAEFISNTDTEVIIQAYLYWGVYAFSKLRGMFAFGLYDAVQNKTYLVRDTSGIKPLYYRIDEHQLYFASEVKALNNAGLAGEVDMNWPIRFLAFGHIPEPFTTFKNVFSLQKGHFLCWDHKSSTYEIQSYAQAAASVSIINEAEAYNNIRDALAQTIQRQLLSDAPIGVFLSGGIDSSLITLLADRYKKNSLKTVSIFFDEQAYNESNYQDLVAGKVNSQNFQHLVKQEDFNNALPAVLQDMDMPTADGINSWFISKYAHHDGLKAVLSGLGGDELFGGYPSFKRIRYLAWLRKLPRFAVKVISKMSMGRYKRMELLYHDHPIAEYLLLRGLFTPSEIADILEVNLQYVLTVLFATPVRVDALNKKQKAAWYEENLYMQNQLLRDTDVMSMAHGLEVRVPFLDEDFMQTAKQIAPEIRFNSSKPKKLLVDSYTDLLPKEIWNRAKMGFSFPLKQWMQQHQEIGNPNHYKNPKARGIIRQFLNGRVHWSRAYALYQLQTHQFELPQQQSKKILLLTLQTFSSTGGIQKMGRTMGYALQQIADKRHWQFNLWSGYDRADELNPSYIRADNFKGFDRNRRMFALNAIGRGTNSDVVILSHINLALIGWMAKMLNPNVKIWLIAHGIEVWRPLSKNKRRLLNICSKIICVSHFTRQKMIDLHHVDPAKCLVLNNTLDPLIKSPVSFEKPDYLLKRYGLTSQDKIIFTLTRMASTEQYKGYEQVIKALCNIKKRIPNIKYVLAGKYDNIEKKRLQQLIKECGVEEQVIMTGFVDEKDLTDHFLMADLFVLPSKKEGFGIVFIEALACGLPVICGNEDGSLDAIRNGELGRAINPNSAFELEKAIYESLQVDLSPEHRRYLQNKCLEYFDLNGYTNKLEEILDQ